MTIDGFDNTVCTVGCKLKKLRALIANFKVVVVVAVVVVVFFLLIKPVPTCGFVAQLVERPTSIWEARVQAPSKPEFFSGFFFCNFFNCSLSARINSLLITRRSNMNYFIYYL